MSFSLKRSLLVKFHLILSGLTLPIILMFFITGSLQTLDISAKSKTIKWRSTQDVPLINNLQHMIDLAEKELQHKGISSPWGKPRIRKNKKRKTFALKWIGINHTLHVRASSSNPKVAVFKLTTPSIYSRFWALHKAAGNDWFDVFVAIQSAILLTLVIIGVIIGLQTKTYRKTLVIALTSGLITFLLFVAMSRY